jgi:hypothetical protein
MTGAGIIGLWSASETASAKPGSGTCRDRAGDVETDDTSFTAPVFVVPDGLLDVREATVRTASNGQIDVRLEVSEPLEAALAATRDSPQAMYSREWTYQVTLSQQKDSGSGRFVNLSFKETWPDYNLVASASFVGPDVPDETEEGTVSIAGSTVTARMPAPGLHPWLPTNFRVSSEQDGNYSSSDDCGSGDNEGDGTALRPS